MALGAPAETIWETIAREAARESELWGAALLPPDERAEETVFSPLGDGRYALGVETIYEGYLLHYGRPRLFAPPDSGAAVLLGDYLLAHGLVRIAREGDAEAVADVAELLAACAHLRAERLPGDGAVWAAAVSQLAAWRDTFALADGEEAWRAAAERVAGADEVARALTLHGERARPSDP